VLLLKNFDLIVAMARRLAAGAKKNDEGAATNV